MRSSAFPVRALEFRRSSGSWEENPSCIVLSQISSEDVEGEIEIFFSIKEEARSQNRAVGLADQKD